MVEILKLKNITKSYKTEGYVQNALDDVSISFRRNEFASILGESGSGKTTMLNIIGGLDQYDSGDLLIEGTSTKEYKDSEWDTYRNNRVGFVFQSFNLIPHQTILSNVELALTLSGISPNEREERAKEVLKDVGLIEHIHKLPNQISGGQMQRVAIARALVNDPEIVLADEPTGSLDSETSEQVMDLLKEIASDKLVVMVTHNPDIANEYSDRIIELKDGQVIGDTNPYVAKKGEDFRSKKPHGKSKMSFLTAISLSISNLLTKKGRTLITAIAGSIGIIGIAAILALASGIDLYIEGIEQDTMSAYPVSIDSSGIDITSFLEGGSGPMQGGRRESEEDKINVVDTFTSLFAQQNKNDLKSFKNHIESNRDDIDPYVENIQYKYGITPQIYLKNEEAGLRQVNPDTVFSESGFDGPSGFDMISGAGNFGMKNFTELPGDDALFDEQYDMVAGRWPEGKNELLVVLMDSGSLTDRTMYALGLRDRKNLKDVFEDFASDEKVEFDNKGREEVPYEEVLGTSFKVINAAEKYTFDEAYDIWVDKSDNGEYMDKLIDEGMDLDVVGIIKAKEDVNTPMLSSGIYYPEELIQHLIQEASNYDIVKQQLENEEVNVFTNTRFDAEEEFDPEEVFQLEDFITIDQSMIENSFNFDPSVLDVGISDFDINIDGIDFPSLDLEALAEEIGTQIDVPVEEVQGILVSVLQDFVKTQEEQEVTELEEWVDNFNEYIMTEEVQNRLIEDFQKINDNNQITQKLTEIVQNYFSSYVSTSFNQVMEEVQSDISRQIQSKIPELAGNIQRGISIDSDMLSQAFQFNLEEDELFELVSSLGDRDQVNQNSNLKKLGYKDLDEPSQIDIYPKDFETKEGVVGFIDDYNRRMEETNQEEKVVKYTDLISALLSSVTSIIDTITYALIAFVAISLVVSSIMIGVITYVSVLERIKEIGILRAIGASKKDIRRVFNAETLIIGAVAGIIGILVTYVLSYFANIIVYDRFGIPNIATLQLKAAGALILISMVLAFISGLIPSSAAAKKDPVEALRSE